jgi:hypothetical protein
VSIAKPIFNRFSLDTVEGPVEHPAKARAIKNTSKDLNLIYLIFPSAKAAKVMSRLKQKIQISAKPTGPATRYPSPPVAETRTLQKPARCRNPHVAEARTK